MPNVEFVKIKVPPEKSEMRQFFKLVELARVDHEEYLIVLTPRQFEKYFGIFICNNNQNDV